MTNIALDEKIILEEYQQKLDLTDEQTKKLGKLISNSNQTNASNLSLSLDLDTDEKGFVTYARQLTTVVPIKFNATGVLTFPAEGEWSIKVYMNGSMIFQQSGVRANQPIVISGWTGWGTSNLQVEAKWSNSAKTHVKITISI